MERVRLARVDKALLWVCGIAAALSVIAVGFSLGEASSRRPHISYVRVSTDGITRKQIEVLGQCSFLATLVSIPLLLGKAAGILIAKRLHSSWFVAILLLVAVMAFVLSLAGFWVGTYVCEDLPPWLP